jgi:hypothetical protein
VGQREEWQTTENDGLPHRVNRIGASADTVHFI